MALFKLGNDYFAWFSAALAGTYTLPAGQQTGTINFTKGTFDAATKDSGGFAVEGVTLISSKFSLAVEPLLPDATGYTLLESSFFAVPAVPIYMKIRRGGQTATDADTIYAAPYWVSGMDASFPINNVVVTPFNFALAGAPSVPFVLR